MSDYKKVTVPSISCSHCTATIESEMSGLPGINSVKADVEDKSVVFEWGDPTNWEQIVNLMDEIGHPVKE